MLRECQKIIDADVFSTVPVSGGDINQASQLNTSSGKFFLKTNTAPFAKEMFSAEAAGLKILEETGVLRTPKVIGCGSENEVSFLLLSFIESGYQPKGFWEKFGAELATLHRSSMPNFGLGHDNFIGSLHQQNCQHSTWPAFYIHERLLPQLEVAKQKNRLQTADFQLFEQIFKRLPELCPTEPPALIHGDLWSGNFLCDENGNPSIFDPAVSYSHREMDIAMCRLFGGFDRAFYRSYEAVWPLAPGFEERIQVYQLYYLMVHANLFGGGYVGQVQSIIKQFI